MCHISCMHLEEHAQAGLEERLARLPAQAAAAAGARAIAIRSHRVPAAIATTLGAAVRLGRLPEPQCTKLELAWRGPAKGRRHILLTGHAADRRPRAIAAQLLRGLKAAVSKGSIQSASSAVKLPRRQGKTRRSMIAQAAAPARGGTYRRRPLGADRRRSSARCRAHRPADALLPRSQMCEPVWFVQLPVTCRRQR